MARNAHHAGGSLRLALRCELLVVAWLAAAVAEVALGRFSFAADIGGAGFGPAGGRIAVASAVLQNTLEQEVLAVVAHLGWRATCAGGRWCCCSCS